MKSLYNQNPIILDLSTWEGYQVLELLVRLTRYEKTQFLKIGKRDIKRILPDFSYRKISEAIDEMDERGYIKVYGRGRLVVLGGDVDFVDPDEAVGVING